MESPDPELPFAEGVAGVTNGSRAMTICWLVPCGVKLSLTPPYPDAFVWIEYVPEYSATEMVPSEPVSTIVDHGIPAEVVPPMVTVAKVTGSPDCALTMSPSICVEGGK